MDDGARGVVTAGVVAGGFAARAAVLQLQDQGLEDFAEHLRVNGHVHVQRRVLADGEVVGFEQVVEDVLEGVVADGEFVVTADVVVALFGAVFVGEEAAVEERQVVAGQVGLRAFGAELDEERAEEVIQIGAAARVPVEVLAEAVGEAIALTIEPALALDEVEEEQAVEEGLGFAFDDCLRPAWMAVGDLVAEPLEDVAEVGEELPGDGFLVKGAGPLGQPGSGVRAVVLGPGELGQVILQEGAQVIAAAPPAKGGQTGAPGLLAAKMGEGDAFVIGRGTEEQEVVVLPGLEGGTPAAVRDEAAQDLTQRGAIDLKIGELDHEDAPRLAGDERAELANDATVQPLSGGVRQAQFVAGPVEGRLVSEGVAGKGPVEFIAQVGDELVEAFDGAEVGGHGESGARRALSARFFE